MDEPTNPTFSPADKASGQPASLWKKARLVLRRAVFWSYERGSWQYDVIVGVILAFLFLTPRAWFNDRPSLQLTDLRHVQGIVEAGHTKQGWVYDVDERLVRSLKVEPTAEAFEELLHRRVSGPFTVTSVVPIRNNAGVVLGYRIVVTRP